MAKKDSNIDLRITLADNGYVIHHSESLSRGTPHRLAVATDDLDNLIDVVRELILNGMETH